MYTQEQLDAQLARYANAPMKALLCVKNTFHLRMNLTETQQAQLAAVMQLIPERKAADRREYHKTRYHNQRLASPAASR